MLELEECNGFERLRADSLGGVPTTSLEELLKKDPNPEEVEGEVEGFENDVWKEFWDGKGRKGFMKEEAKGDCPC